LFARRSAVLEEEPEEPLQTIQEQEKEEAPKTTRSLSPSRAPPPPAKKARTTPSPAPVASPAPTEDQVSDEAEDTSDIMITRDIETITVSVFFFQAFLLLLTAISDKNSYEPR
jgi:hypothetical protein